MQLLILAGLLNAGGMKNARHNEKLYGFFLNAALLLRFLRL